MASPLELKCTWIDLAALAIDNKFLEDLPGGPRAQGYDPLNPSKSNASTGTFDAASRSGSLLRNHRLDCLLYRNHSSYLTNFLMLNFRSARPCGPSHPYYNTCPRDDERPGVQACLPRIAIKRGII